MASEDTRIDINTATTEVLADLSLLPVSGES
jgi:hypothetical protein